MSVSFAWRDKNVFWDRPGRAVRRTIEWAEMAGGETYFMVADYDAKRFCILRRRCDFEDLPLDLAVAALAKQAECYAALEIPLEVLPDDLRDLAGSPRTA